MKTDLKSALKFRSDHNYKLNENIINNTIISMYIKTQNVPCAMVKFDT